MRKQLTDLCTIQYGYAFDSESFTTDNSFPPLVRIRDVKRGFSETFYSGDYPPEYVIHSGDLLVGMDGEFNIARWRSGDALLNQRVCKISATRGTDEEYLRFALQKALKEIEDRTAFVTVKHLSAKELNKLELDIPDMGEQARIAQILCKLERVISMREAELSALDDLIKARFVEMFGDPVANTLEWKTALLREVTSKIGSGATPRGGKESYQAEGITLIRSMNVHDGRFEYKDLAHITDEQAAQLNNVSVEEGDVFINITGASVARSCIVPKDTLPARVNQHVAIIRCVRNLLNPTFANNMFLNDRFKEQLLDIGESGGATRQAITKQQLEGLTVILPPMNQQEEFAAFVAQIDKSKSVIQKSLDETQLLFDSLMQQYFG